MTSEATETLLPVLEGQSTDAERAGIHDGRLGQTWREYRRVLEYKAEQQRIDDECAVNKQIEAQQAELARALEAEERARMETARVEAHYLKVANDRDHRPADYSRVWGALFVLLAFLLVAADFPLTRQIVSAMSIGTDAVPTTEQVLVSIGIVAMSLFFKLLTDPFTQPQYMMGSVRRIVTQTISVLLMVTMLGGVLAMLFLLGMFRAGAIQSDTAVSASETVIPAAPALDSPAQSVTPNPIDSQLRALERFRDFTFIIMGLILPVIGGIFASVGMSRIHNAGRLRLLEADCHHVRHTLDEAVQMSQAAGASIRSLRHELTAIGKRLLLVGGEYHSYLHAYQTGYCTPDAARGRVGMAIRVRDVVDKWAAIVDQSQNLVRTELVSKDVQPEPGSGRMGGADRGVEPETSGEPSTEVAVRGA